MIVARSKLDYLWLFAREPQMRDADYARYKEMIAEWGYDIKRAISDAVVCCTNTVQSPVRTPLATTAFATSAVMSVVPRPRVRKASVLWKIMEQWAVYWKRFSNYDKGPAC